MGDEKAKTDRAAKPEAADTADTAAIDAGRAARRSALLFTVKTVMATVGGGLLTLFITTAQITYQQHLEVLQRQSEQGQLFQAQLFQATGHIENELSDIYSSLDEDDGTPVDAAIHERLDNLADQWRLARLQFRVRGAQIYGRGVGDLIYDPAEERFALDACGIEIRGGDREAGANCGPRRQAEALRLRRLFEGLRDQVSANRDPSWEPASFQTNFRLTRAILHAYVDCRINLNNAPGVTGGAPGVSNPRCAEMGAMLQILARRIDLMVLVREQLSTAIMRSSALSD
jgi:hypothetical protein